MSEPWPALAPQQTVVLVTVAQVQGSAPREPGARLLVSQQSCHGSIGGGHLEWHATARARAMLASNEERWVERLALGPSLGQCCGGVTWLVFERLDQARYALLRARHGQDSCRIVALDGEPDWALLDQHGTLLAGQAAPALCDLAQQEHTHLHVDAAGRRWLIDPMRAPRAHLMLFGAGHVGAALVRALAELPCRVTWVDERDDLFLATVPANVRIEVSDDAAQLAAQAPAGTTFLIMTHSHALDLALAHAILSRREDGWCGLIGSLTKRNRFQTRLRAYGVADARIASMVCPIGLPGIDGKAPAVIAASVTAQLLALWEAPDSPSRMIESV